MFWALAIAQLGIVFVLSARVDRMAAGTASMLFVAYSALTGVTLSAILLVYTGESVFTTFVVAAGMFGALAAYGTVTRRQLSGLGQFLFMGLIGLVLASIVGIFWLVEVIIASVAANSGNEHRYPLTLRFVN